MFEKRVHRTAFFALIAVAFFASSAAPASAQPAGLARRTEPISWSSGAHDGPVAAAAQARMVASQVISVPGAPWIQLEFSGANLGRRSRIEMRSLFDGATQTLDADSFRQWGSRSAYFNGDAVEIRLYGGRGDRGARVEVSSVVAGEWGSLSTESLCGSDNRVASSDPRTARIDPIGCTGWVMSNGTLLTAGHCLAGSGNTTLSFNVPPSLSGGTVQFPGPEYQYAINAGSFQFVNGGVGNDWGVFTVANNSQTGLQPIHAQGGFNVQQNLTPATIRVTGYGTDSGTTNQTNQTATGPNAGSSGTTLNYQTDTQPGNSGSPVIDEATGLAVGIHTHGGCTAISGANRGTSFFNTALWTAIDPSFAKNCVDLVPVLTGPSAAVSTSGIISSTYEAWQAFDAPGTSMWISETFETPAWIAYDFGSNQVVNRYTVTHRNGTLTSRAPKNFTFEGWNGASWVVIDTRVNQTAWISGLPRTYEVAAPGSYSQYRLHVTDDNDSRAGVVVISLEDLSFEQCGCAATSDQVPTLTGNTPALSTSGVFSSTYPAWHAFDASTTQWISETNETPAWLAYDWGTSTRLITQYNLTNTNGSLTSRAPMDFTLQGWNGSAWVTVDARVGETGWVSGVPRSYPVATPGLFRQYRLHITDDNDVRPGVVVISLGNVELMGCR